MFVVVFVVAVFSFVVVAEFLAALDAMSHSVSIDVVVFILFASQYINLFKELLFSRYCLKGRNNISVLPPTSRNGRKYLDRF